MIARVNWIRVSLIRTLAVVMCFLSFISVNLKIHFTRETFIPRILLTSWFLLVLFSNFIGILEISLNYNNTEIPRTFRRRLTAEARRYQELTQFFNFLAIRIGYSFVVTELWTMSLFDVNLKKLPALNIFASLILVLEILAEIEKKSGKKKAHLHYRENDNLIIPTATTRISKFRKRVFKTFWTTVQRRHPGLIKTNLTEYISRFQFISYCQVVGHVVLAFWIQSPFNLLAATVMLLSIIAFNTDKRFDWISKRELDALCHCVAAPILVLAIQDVIQIKYLKSGP